MDCQVYIAIKNTNETLEVNDMINFSDKLFISFSAKDRYDIVQPIVYHLKNYGINIWYDRYEMVMGDNRFKKNIDEGAGKCGYALIILSPNTAGSLCATEEIKILESRYHKKEIVIFPVLYELNPRDIPSQFAWVKELIFKEVDRSTGTLEICNHIACKITQNMLQNCNYKSIAEVINGSHQLPKAIEILLHKYIRIDAANLNSRVTLLYTLYIIIVESDNFPKSLSQVPIKVFERLFEETLLNLKIDYRELWLLENCLCLLIEVYIKSCTESNI